jgi:ankyrin repeat protein
MKQLPALFLAASLLASCDAANDALPNVKASDIFPAGAAVAFAEAAARGQTERAKQLLETGADINVRGKDGATPLLWTLLKGNKTGFRFLLERGADANLQVKQGNSVMSFAAMHEDPEFLTLALKYGGDPNLVDPVTAKTPIFESITNMRMHNIRLLIKAGANLNFRDRTGSTPMMQAAGINQYQVVHAMLQAGADPKVKNNWGNTITYFVKESNMNPKHELYQWRAKVIELLKERGIKVD